MVETILVFMMVFFAVTIVAGVLATCWKVGKKIAEKDDK